MPYAEMGQGIIDRDTLQSMPGTYFVFGDNVSKVGTGGQAGVARGEPNTIGIPTKWHPGWGENDYFNDRDFTTIRPYIDQAFIEIINVLHHGFNVVFFPQIGRGLARLPTRAPAVMAHIDSKVVDILTKYPKR